MKKAKAKTEGPKLLWVEIVEAKPNEMFTEEQCSAVRFLRFSERVPCAECGKRRSTVLWTMLTPVCGVHPLAPAWPEESK